MADAIDVLVEELLAYAKTAPIHPDPDYPTDHKAAMRVPKGGSSCESCRFVSEDKRHCSNEHYIKWNNGSKDLPLPADEYCSDWYEPRDVEAVGTSEGATKGWDTRGRGREEEKYQGDGHGTKLTDMRELKEGWLAKDGMFYANMDRIHSQTAQYHKLAPPENPLHPWATGAAVDNGHIRVSPGNHTLVLEGRDDDSGVVERMRDLLVLAKQENPVVMEFVRMPKIGGNYTRDEFRSKDFENPGAADEWLQSGAIHASEEIDVDAAIEDLLAYGTSEGVKKEWDTRGRGRKPQEEMWKYRLYRGTTTRKLAEIAKQGITPPAVPMAVKNEYQSMEAHPVPGHVYFTYDHNLARIYAGFKQAYNEAEPGTTFEFHNLWTKPPDAPPVVHDTKPVVLTLRVPKSIAEKLEEDPESPEELESVMFKGTIPKDYIEKAEVQEGGVWKPLSWEKAVAADADGDTVKIYCVLDDVKQLGHSLKAFGTSEGVKKAWDARGRGIHEHPKFDTVPGVHEATEKDIESLKNWPMIARMQNGNRQVMARARSAANVGAWIRDDYDPDSFDKFFVVDSEKNGVVGAVHILNGEENILVGTLATRPDVITGAIAERGVGTKLMIQAAKYASAFGQGVELDALSGAESFYRKLGMHERPGTFDPAHNDMAHFSWTAEEAKQMAEGKVQ